MSTKNELTLTKRSDNKRMARILATSSNEKERRDAANGIYRAFRSLLVNYFTRNSGASADVKSCDDLTLVTLEKVFEKIHQYDPKGGEFSTWVFKVALNTLIDHKRKGRFKDVVSTETANYNFEQSDTEGDPGLIELPSQEPTPLQQAIKSQEHLMVRQAVERMVNVRERMVIKLRFFEQRTYEEIAEELMLPMGTVKVVIHRAKRNLQRSLAPAIQRR